MVRTMAVNGGTFFILVLALSAGHGQDALKNKAAPPADTKEAVMKRKLAQAQKLLEGLAINDFPKILAAADELAILRQKASFMALRTREYQVFTNEFQRQIEAVQKAAKKKNIDGVALAYVDMTLTCVKCHQYVREEAIGFAPPANWNCRVVATSK